MTYTVFGGMLNLARLNCTCIVLLCSVNSFGNRTSPLDSSNDHWKRLCLFSWAVAPCVWTL